MFKGAMCWKNRRRLFHFPLLREPYMYNKGLLGRGNGWAKTGLSEPWSEWALGGLVPFDVQ